MKEEWLEVIEWIQLSVTLVYLIIMLAVLALVIKYNNLEFNGLWKTRATLGTFLLLFLITGIIIYLFNCNACGCCYTFMITNNNYLGRIESKS